MIKNVIVPSIKKRTLLGSYYYTTYQPIAGALRATGAASVAARSRGKLCFHFGLYLHHAHKSLGVGRYWRITSHAWETA